MKQGKPIIWTAISLTLCAGVGWALSTQTSRLGDPGVVMGSYYEYRDAEDVLRSATTNSVALPVKVPGYTSTTDEVTWEEISWLPQDTSYGRRLYRPTGAKSIGSIQVNAILMGYDRTSIHKPQYCLPANGFAIDTDEDVSINVPAFGGIAIPMRRIVTTRMWEGQEIRGIYYYVFASEDQVCSSHSQRMLWMARDLLREQVLKRWAYVSFFTMCYPGAEQATMDRLSQFIGLAIPEIFTDELIESIVGGDAFAAEARTDSVSEF